MSLWRSSVLVVASAVLAFGGCGGKTTQDQDLVVSDSQPLAAPEGPTGTGGAGGQSGDDGDDDADRGDDGCRDGDHDGHHHHRHHWFKILDGLDGSKDGKITIASLPPGLPERLIDRLKKIDANGDGVVTREEVKAARKHRHHHRGDHDGDDRDDD